MSWRVIIRPKAEADLREARLWYETQRTGLGDELLQEIGRTIERTAEIAFMSNTESVLNQTVEQLERLNEALAKLRRELLPGQSKKFAILAESPLEDMRRLQTEIEQLTAEIAAAPATKS